MKEIRYRTDVINKAISSLQNGGALTGYKESDIELIFLQFRHCLELMMMGSLAAHHAHGYKLTQRFLKKEYNASKLLRFIKAKNPKFYPSPVKVRGDKGEDGRFVTEPITDGFLTQDDFCKLYDRACGRMLHAQRKSKFAGRHDQLIEEAVYYRDRLMKLLNCHWINLTDEIAFAVFMVDSKTGEVGLNVMERIDAHSPTRTKND
jgi:hypothetical protein